MHQMLDMLSLDAAAWCTVDALLLDSVCHHPSRTGGAVAAASVRMFG
jgi:hypothetical protein